MEEKQIASCCFWGAAATVFAAELGESGQGRHKADRHKLRLMWRRGICGMAQHDQECIPNNADAKIVGVKIARIFFSQMKGSVVLR